MRSFGNSGDVLPEDRKLSSGLLATPFLAAKLPIVGGVETQIDGSLSHDLGRPLRQVERAECLLIKHG
jgi:hypothetical protein